MQLNQIINLHKGITPLFVLVLMTSYQNFSLPCLIYLALHGTYGILWLVKERIFPDSYFREKINLITGISGFIFLGSYWIAPFILISSGKTVPDIIVALSVSINIFGVFLHFASDSQKYFMLKIKKELIQEGFFKRIRNTNYLGETLIYFSFAMLSMSILPFIVLGLFFIFIFIPRMIKKDKSLGKYNDFGKYKQNSGLIFPKIFNE